MLNPGRVCGVLLTSVILILVSVGCASSQRAVPDDPIVASRRADLPADDRVAAIRRAKADADAGRADPSILRLAMKDLAWSLEAPDPVRVAALEVLLWDEAEQEDSLTLVREMLPTEPGRGPVAVMATASADHRWLGATPALVRSLARPLPGVRDADRAEYKALRTLYPDEPPEGVALAVFLDPQTDPGPAGLALDMRVREAAWDLIGRLSPDPRARASLLDSAPSGDGAGILAALREVRDRLGAVPATGEELRWALRLHEQREAELRVWWEQASAAVLGVGGEGRETLALRHVEPVRWAGQNRSEWLGAGRGQLLDELRERLRGRQIYPRTQSVRGTATANAERLAEARDALVWGDALALLVVDEALARPEVRAALFEAADADHKDSTTEHGGMLWSDARGFHVQSFPPRGSTTPDDRRFTAPREMIEHSSAAAAHFHMHVSQRRNRDYAGPSPEDLDYAARFGRTCIVLTSLDSSTLNADVYFPTGAVVDLGELERASSRP